MVRNGLNSRFILLRQRFRYHPSAKFLPYPSSHISIRGIQEETYAVVDVTNREPKLLEEIEVSRAMFEAFEGAVVGLDR